MTVKLFTEFKHDDVHFHAPTFNAKGQKNVDMSYDPMSTAFIHRIGIQLAKDTKPIISKWRLSEPREGEDGKRRNWELKLEDPDLVKVLKDFDEYILNYAVNNSRTLFKKDLNRDQVEARYKEIVKPPKENDDCPYMIVKVSCPPSDNPTPIKTIKEDGRTLSNGTIDDLTKDAEVVPIVRTGGLWFMTDSFGVSFSAYKLIVKPKPQLAFKDHFILENDYDDESEEHASKDEVTSSKDESEDADLS
tara:strand:+ start:970 stop:1710 length:741 start_codon:yes stop_codon:yes gene_type:complete